MTTRTAPWAVFAAVLIAIAAYALLRALTAPAEVSGVVSAHCALGQFSLRAHAYYRSEGDRWKIYKVLYRIRGRGRDFPLGLLEGTGLSSYVRGLYNNLHVQVVSGGESAYAYRSPDSRVADQLFRESLTADADRSKPTYVRFRAIFDVANRADPSCDARTPALPVA